MLTIVFIAVPFLIIAFAMIIGKALSTQPYHGPITKNFDGKTFINPSNVKSKGLRDLMRYLFSRDQGPWTKNYETFVGEKPTIHTGNKVRITFVNHSSFLIQWNGLNILTDPVWSDRCSPFSFVGPQRMRPPGIHFDDLPTIDLILLSHNHYDHLDIATVRKLWNTHQPSLIVPLGVADYLRKNQIERVEELDWWKQTSEKIKVTALPAQHFSGRGMYDRDKSLWCGYLLELDGTKLYYAGDSGYGDHFKEIGKKAGPMDISLIPIGAYLPRWFMSPIHVSPDESIKIHQDVKSAQSIAMHFGTFPLADDGMGQAEADLKEAIKNSKIDPKTFLIPDEGIPMEF